MSCHRALTSLNFLILHIRPFSSAISVVFNWGLGFRQYSPGIPRVYNLELGSSKYTEVPLVSGMFYRGSAPPQSLKTTVLHRSLRTSYGTRALHT